MFWIVGTLWCYWNWFVPGIISGAIYIYMLYLWNYRSINPCHDIWSRKSAWRWKVAGPCILFWEERCWNWSETWQWGRGWLLGTSDSRLSERFDAAIDLTSLLKKLVLSSLVNSYCKILHINLLMLLSSKWWYYPFLQFEWSHSNLIDMRIPRWVCQSEGTTIKEILSTADCQSTSSKFYNVWLFAVKTLEVGRCDLFLARAKNCELHVCIEYMKIHDFDAGARDGC